MISFELFTRFFYNPLVAVGDGKAISNDKASLDVTALRKGSACTATVAPELSDSETSVDTDANLWSEAPLLSPEFHTSRLSDVAKHRKPSPSKRHQPVLHSIKKADQNRRHSLGSIHG